MSEIAVLPPQDEMQRQQDQAANEAAVIAAAEAAAQGAAAAEASRARRMLDAVTGAYSDATAWASSQLLSRTSAEGRGTMGEMADRIRKYTLFARIGKAALTGGVLVAGAVLGAKGHDTSMVDAATNALTSGGGNGHIDHLDHATSAAPDMHLAGNETDLHVAAHQETATLPEFSKGAEEIHKGEGWYHQLKEMGITDPKEQAAFLKEHGKELEEQGLAYKMGDSWGLNIGDEVDKHGNGHFETEDLKDIHNMAVEDGYLSKTGHDTATGAGSGTENGPSTGTDTDTEPGAKPTAEPTIKPTEEPSPHATTEPTEASTTEPTPHPTTTPTAEHSHPTAEPVAEQSESSLGTVAFASGVLLAGSGAAGYARHQVTEGRRDRAVNSADAISDFYAFHPDAIPTGVRPDTASRQLSGEEQTALADLSSTELSDLIEVEKQVLAKNSKAAPERKKKAKARIDVARRLLDQRMGLMNKAMPAVNALAAAGLDDTPQNLGAAKNYLSMKPRQLRAAYAAELALPVDEQNPAALDLYQAVAHSRGIDLAAVTTAETAAASTPVEGQTRRRRIFGRRTKPATTASSAANDEEEALPDFDAYNRARARDAAVYDEEPAVITEESDFFDDDEDDRRAVPVSAPPAQRPSWGNETTAARPVVAPSTEDPNQTWGVYDEEDGFKTGDVTDETSAPDGRRPASLADLPNGDSLDPVAVQRAANDAAEKRNAGYDSIVYDVMQGDGGEDVATAREAAFRNIDALTDDEFDTFVGYVRGKFAGDEPVLRLMDEEVRYRQQKRQSTASGM